MKYIKLFETHSLYEAYIADTVNFVRPNVSYCEDYSHVHYNNLLEISSALITCDSAIYNGETQIATNIVVMSGSVVLTNNTDYVVINNNGGINAGSYTFTIRGIGNYKGYKNGTFIINKMTPTVVAPTAKVLTYNGSAQELINAGSTNAGTLQYKVDDGSWSTNIPTGTNGGSYNVLYKVVGNNNVNDVEALSILCSINEKEVTATVELSLDTYTYSGNAYEPTVTVKDGGTIIPSSEYTVTYSNNINAGTATVTIIDNTGGNYAVIGSTTFTIEKATGSVTTIPVNKAVTYNESAQIVADAGAGTGTMMYRLGDSGDFSSSMPTATNAGTYTLYFYAAESANYLQSATQNIEVTISKAIPSYTSPQGKDNLIYSGESQELLIEGSSPDGIIKYSSDGGETWDINVPEGINVVTYHLQWKVFGDSNHTDSTPINIDVSIAKVTPTVTAPTIVSNLEYTGAAQNLLNNDGSTNFGTLQYSSDNETFSTTIPTGTNAGSYDVWYRVQGDSNVNDVSSVKLTNSIAKVDACYIAPTAAMGLVYDESSQALLNAGSSTCGTVLYSSDETNWSTNIPEGTNAGDYTSYWRVVADSNHIDKPSASIITNIDKAAGEIYTAPTPITGLVYNDTALSLITAGSGTGTMQYKVDSGSWESSIPTMINAGTYTIYYKVLESSNYYATDGTDYITTTIAKVTPTVTAPTPRVLTYNTSSLALVNAGSTNYGTMQYKVGSDSWSTSIPTRTRGGSYTVYYKVVGDSNINDVASASTQCSINEKPVTAVVTVSPSSYTYSGSYCEPTVTVKDGETVIDPSEYTVVYSNNLNAGTATVTIYDVVGGDYYVTGSTTFEIAKQTPVLATSPTSTSPTYNGSAQDLLTGGSMKHSSSVSTAVPGTFTYDKGTDAKSYTNPKWYFTPTDTTNYNSTNGTVITTTTISCSSSYTITAPTAKTGLVYNGSSQTLYNAGSSATVSGSFGYTGGTMTNAGSQTVSWAFTPSSANYCAKNGSFTGSIAQKAISIPTPTGVSKAYNGNAATATFGSATGAGITKYRYSTNGSSWTESTTNPSQTNAGTLYTQAYYKANDANYSGEGWSSSATISISCASQSAPTATGATTTYPTSATATASGGGGQGSLEWESAQSQTSVGSHSTRARWSGNSNYNASPWSNSVTVQMNKAAGSVTIVPVNTNYTYNGTALAVASAGSGTGTMYYRLGSSGSFSTTMPTMTNAGSNTLYYYAAASTNYNQSSTGSITVSVQKANQSAPTATGASVVYGNTATATASGGGGQGSLEWSNGNTLTGNAGSSKTTKARWSGNSNYNASSYSNEVTLSIIKANQSAPTAYGATTTYPTTATATASGGSGQGSLEWSNGNTQTSVGSKTTKARWSSNGNYNASNWSNEVTVKMNKANQTISFDSSTASVNVGSSLAKTATRSVGDGAITYSSSNTSIATFNSSTGVVTGVSEGTCTITATAASTTNYNSASVSLTLTVTKKELLITASLTNASNWGFINGTATLTLTGALGSITSRSSSNTSVATIDSNNVITIKGKGTATITINVSATTEYKAATVTYTVNLKHRHTYYNGTKYYEFSDGHLWGVTSPNNIPGYTTNASSSTVASLLNNQYTAKNYTSSTKRTLRVYDLVTGEYLNLPTLNSTSYGHTSDKVVVIHCSNGYTLEVTNSGVYSADRSYSSYCGLAYLD